MVGVEFIGQKEYDQGWDVCIEMTTLGHFRTRGRFCAALDQLHEAARLN